MPRVWGHLLQGSRQIAPQVWSIAPILCRAFGLLLIRSPPPAVGHYHDLQRRRHHDVVGSLPALAAESSTRSSRWDRWSAPSSRGEGRCGVGVRHHFDQRGDTRFK